MHVGLLNQMQWNIKLIQVLCCGEWRSAVFIPGQEIDTNTVCGSWLWFHIPRWQRPDQLCCCYSFCCSTVHMCDETDREKKDCVWLVRALSRHMWGHEGLQLGRIPTLHTWLKVIPPGLRWAQISVCQKCNWRNLKIHPSRWGQIASPCPAMWGPLTERMNTIEGLFLPEQAKGRPDDERPLDSRKRTAGKSKRTGEGDRISWSSIWNRVRTR